MEMYEILERELGYWTGRKGTTVVCSSGTAALHLALEVLDLPPGSLVAVPDICMIAVPRAVVLAGHTPLFIGVTSDLLMDVSSLDKALDLHPIKAILPVHTYGRRCDMEAIHELAAKHDVPVVEDMAEIHGVSPHEDSFAGCYSFYKNKIVHGEEGGCVAVQSTEIATKLRSLRSLGFTDNHDFTHIPRGHNYRMANALAYPIASSLLNFDKEVSKRWDSYWVYEDRSPREWRRKDQGIKVPLSPWVYDIRVPGLGFVEGSIIISRLKEIGIEARHCFKPFYMQEEFRRHCCVADIAKESPLKLSREILYLPLLDKEGLPIATDKAQEVFSIIKNYA